MSPVTYVCASGSAKRVTGDPLEARVVTAAEPVNDPSRERITTDILGGRTAYLRHLHAHTTLLRPGAGYEPHADSYDVCIVTMAGTVKTLGERVEAPGVVFYAAGQPHGMRNVSDAPAHYLVFELHGRHSTSGRVDDRSFGERLVRLARERTVCGWRRERRARVHGLLR